MNTTPQLTDHAWAVITNRDTVTSDLTYDEARELADRQNSEREGSATITTAEAARKLSREKIEL